jgi:uncharacterized protein (TIGR02271 family)
VTVEAPADRAEDVADIMDKHGAVDIDRRAERFRESGYTGYDPSAAAYAYDEAVREREHYRDERGPNSIPVIEEELQVGKRVVRHGSVRIHSHVIEEPVEEEVTLREERVRVDRRAVDRALEPGEASRLRDQTIEVTEMSEEPVVQKRARVREEVVVSKEAKERTERISDTVRRTEVHVDRSGDGSDADMADFRSDYEKNYAKTGAPWETYRPAYEYGYRMASDERYRGRGWSDVEDDLRTDYSSRYPDSAWERMKDAVRRGWEKMTGQR